MEREGPADAAPADPQWKSGDKDKLIDMWIRLLSRQPDAEELGDVTAK